MSPDRPADGVVPVLTFVNFDRVLATRDRLASALARRGHVGCVLEGADLEACVATCAAVLAVPGPPVRRSLADWAGKFLDGPGRHRLAARLAGNVDRLKAGEAVGPWVAQAAPEWAAAVVSRVVWARVPADRWRPERKGYRVWFQFVSGSPAGDTVERFMTSAAAAYTARHVGFDRPGMALEYRDGMDMFGLRVVVLLAPELSAAGRPGFREVVAPAGYKAANRHLLKARRRVGFVCPHGLTDPCYRCGHGLESCPVATHPVDYVTAGCARCGGAAVIDPDARAGPPGVCVRCRSAGSLTVLPEGSHGGQRTDDPVALPDGGGGVQSPDGEGGGEPAVR